MSAFDAMASGQGGCTGTGCFKGCNGSCTWNLALVTLLAYEVFRLIAR
jgi:hypothetical protein